MVSSTSSPAVLYATPSGSSGCLSLICREKCADLGTKLDGWIRIDGYLLTISRYITIPDTVKLSWGSKACTAPDLSPSAKFLEVRRAAGSSVDLCSAGGSQGASRVLHESSSLMTQTMWSAVRSSSASLWRTAFGMMLTILTLPRKPCRSSRKLDWTLGSLTRGWLAAGVGWDRDSRLSAGCIRSTWMPRPRRGGTIAPGATV